MATVGGAGNNGDCSRSVGDSDSDDDDDRGGSGEQRRWKEGATTMERWCELSFFSFGLLRLDLRFEWMDEIYFITIF